MSALDASIRMHRRELDLRRRLLAGLVALRSCLRADTERMGRETALSDAALDPRAERLARSIAEVEAQIVRARAAVHEAIEALARHELAAARRARGGRAARRRSAPN